MLLVQLDQFPVEPLLIVFELGLHGLDLGLNFLHALHGFVALVLQGHEQQLDAAG